MGRVLFALLLTATAIAQPIRQERTVTLYEPTNSPRTQPPTGRVGTLIRHLGAADPDAHEAAERELLALCPAIEPQLRYDLAEEERSAPAPLQKSAPMNQEYVRGGGFMRFQPADVLPRGAYHSLTVLLERCEELSHAKPAIVTLNARDALLPDIFRQLGQQIGVPVSVLARSYDGAVDPAGLNWFQNARATVQINRVPYWGALRTILGAIHPVGINSVELFVYVGSNHIRLVPDPSAGVDLFRNDNAVNAGPLLLLTSYQPTPRPRIVVNAIADPALTAFTGDASLHLTAVTDTQGNSLLPAGDNTRTSAGLEDKDFDAKIGYAFDPADGQLSWRQSVPVVAPAPGEGVATVRGTFRVGFGVNEQLGANPPGSGFSGGNIGIPLAAFHPEGLDPTPAEERVYVLQDCKVLQPGSADKPVYVRDHLDCVAHGIDRGGGGRSGGDTVEGVTLTLANHRDHPVTYISSMAYFVDPAHGFPKPDQVIEATGIYHARAEPGETVRIQMATTYRAGARAPAPQVPGRIPPAPSTAAPQTVVFDGWRLTVLSVTRSGEVYEVTGQLAMPAVGPFGDSEVGSGYIFLNPLDAQGWQIESYPHFSKLRTEGDHLVEDFKVVTREPGRIPADLLWQTPEATHWLSTPFEVHGIKGP